MNSSERDRKRRFAASRLVQIVRLSALMIPLAILMLIEDQPVFAVAFAAIGVVGVTLGIRRWRRL